MKLRGLLGRWEKKSMDVESFAEIEEEFLARVGRRVWCAVSTIDRKDRTRMRVLHPIFEGKEGWVATGRNSHKSKHLARNPHLSLCYIDSSDPQRGFEMVYVDCAAEWNDAQTTKERIWELFKNAPPPMGYDPAIIWKGGPRDPEFGVLALKPWRIELASMSLETGSVSKVWRAP